MAAIRRDDGARWQTRALPGLEPMLLLAAGAEEALAPAHPTLMDHDDQRRENEDRHDRRDDPPERLIHLQSTPEVGEGLAGCGPSVIRKLGCLGGGSGRLDHPPERRARVRVVRSGGR